MNSTPARCFGGVPRRSLSGPRQGVTEPQTNPCWSSCAFRKTGSVCPRFSTAISTESNPHFLNFGNSRVLWLVNGHEKRNVLMPNRITSRYRSHGIDLKSLLRRPSNRTEPGDGCAVRIQFPAGPEQAVGQQTEVSGLCSRFYGVVQ